MGLRPYRARILIAACVLVAASAESQATEYAFSTYGLGSAAFGAGVTPPPGTYVTGATAFYDATIGGALNFGGVIINAGAEVDGFAGSTNILYVPARKVLGGNLGLAVTVPIGHLDVDATVGLLSRETDGWGFGDITSRAQLGWQHGDFAHLIYVQRVEGSSPSTRTNQINKLESSGVPQEPLCGTWAEQFGASLSGTTNDCA